MTAKANDCIAAMQATIATIPALAGKSVFVYGEDDLLDMVKGVISYPAIGIVYEGMRSVGEVGLPSHRIGLSAEAVVSLYLILQGDSIINTDQKKVDAINLLDTVRKAIMDTRSPTGHFWRFLVEAPARLKNGMVFWVQRWSCPVQLPPG